MIVFQYWTPHWKHQSRRDKMAGMSDSPATARIQLGRELATLRKRAGVLREEAVQALMCSLSKLSKIENGQLAPNELEVHTLLQLYGVPDDSDQAKQLKVIGAEARRRTPYRVPEFFRAFVGLEATAACIQTFEIDLVPGLCQTEAYTRALGRAASPGPGAEHLVASRRDRQARLASDNPPRLIAVLHETALHMNVGGPDVMREQLDRLLELASLPNISLQVLPFSVGAYTAMGAPLTILQLPEGDRIVYLQTLWMSNYIRRPVQVTAYSHVFENLCTSACDTESTLDLIKEIKDGIR